MIMDKRPWFGASCWPLALAVAAAAGLLAIGPSSPALAAWSAQASGSAAGAATVMPTGTAPSGSTSGLNVTISWTAAAMGNGAAVAGYTISRYNASGGAKVTAGAGCSGTVTSTTCTEDGVPAGTWVYTDTPVQGHWTGGESPDSTAVVAP
jgi:hypothetical protein